MLVGAIHHPYQAELFINSSSFAKTTLESFYKHIYEEQFDKTILEE